jgi:hypothetical protein
MVSSSSDSSSSNELIEWKQVTPKKEKSSTGVMQNKFLQFPRESASPRYDSQNSRSLNSLNRFDALVGVGATTGRGNSDSLPTISSTPTLLPATPTQQAMQRQIESKMKDLRKRTAPKKRMNENSNASFLDNGYNLRLLNEFITRFQWEGHLGKLENLWFSVLGNPTKFIFILLDYFEECFSNYFPSISFSQSNWMDELPIEALAKNATPSQALLLSNFQGKVAEPIEGFLRMKLESPEFKIEDVFTALLEIIVKCQRLKDGQNSFASVLVLGTLAKIFPFQALLSLRELISSRGISLHQQGFFFLWFAGVIFEEEPSQCGVLVEVVMEETSTQPSSLANAVLLGAFQLLEDLLQETIALYSSNAALLSECQLKLFQLAVHNATLSKAAMQVIWKLSLSLLGPAVCKLEGVITGEFLGQLFELGCKESKVLELAVTLAENWPQTFVRHFLNQFGNVLVYEQFLSTSSRTFLGMLRPTSHSIVIRALDEHTKALLAPSFKWNTSVAQRFGAGRKEALLNSGMLADLSRTLTNRGEHRGHPMKSSRGLFSKVSWVFFAVLAILAAFFLAKEPAARDRVIPVTKQIISFIQQKVHEWHPHVNRASKSLVLYGKRAVETYKPQVQRLTQRYLDHGMALARVYAGPKALRAYKERAGAVLEWARQRLVDWRRVQ